MALRRLSIGVVAVASLTLAACTAVSTVTPDTTVVVAVSESFTSLNPDTGYGSAVDTNVSVAAVTNSSFVTWGEHGERMLDESFGTITKLADDPLTVRYRIADGVEWSDGVPVDAADLLLSWAANSRTLNAEDFEAERFINPDTGRFTEDFPSDVVYFDGFTGNGLQLVTSTPKVSDDGRALTLVFDEHFADWQLVFDVGVPAHVLAERALGAKFDDAEGAKRAVITAIVERKAKVLAPLAHSWNNDFNFADTPEDESLLVGSGPYLLTQLVPGESLTLTANRNYRGERQPHFESVVVRFIADPLEAVAAFEQGALDVVGPRPSADVIAATSSLSGVTKGVEGTHELLQLRFKDSLNGAIENALVRKAFLASVPRDGLIETVREAGTPVAPRDSFVFLPEQPGYDETVEQNGSESYAEMGRSGAASLLERAAASDPALASPTVCVLFDPANPRRVTEFEFIQQSAGATGFTVTDCSSPDWRNLLAAPGAYDAALYGLRAENDSTASVLAALHSSSRLNHGGYVSDEVDSLLNELQFATDIRRRESLLAEIDAILWADAWGLPLFQMPTITAVSDRVEGVERSPFAATVLAKPWEWRPANTP